MSEADPLPNVVCQECWTTTKAFHELYIKSKEVQGKFLNSLVKTEPDPIEIELSTTNEECIPITEEIRSIKLEQPSGDNDLNDIPSTDDLNDSYAENFDDNNDGSTDENEPRDDTTRRQKSKRWNAKKNTKEYQKMFDENRHLFDMQCDCCSKVFESLEEGRAHYLSKHNNSKGYIKTKNGNKLFYRCNVVQQLERHLNPDNFKYVFIFLINYSKYNTIFFPSDVRNVIEASLTNQV